MNLGPPEQQCGDNFYGESDGFYDECDNFGESGVFYGESDNCGESGVFYGESDD